MLLSLEWFQVTALEGGESTQQGTPGEHDFYKRVKEANRVDRELERPEGWCDTVPEGAVVQDSILYKDHHLWVPESMITELLQLTHDESPSGHQGQDWIRSQIEFYYYWFTLYHNINCYTFNCITCKHIKVSQQKSASLLYFFKIFQKHWQNFFCNFITGLSELEGMNAIFIIIDKFSKKWHYILCCIKNKQTSLKKTV